jgi:hypothetical protein
VALSLPATRAPISVPKRLFLFTAAVAAGAVAAGLWSSEHSGWVHNGLIELFAVPGIQNVSLGAGLGLAFLVGFAHLATI